MQRLPLATKSNSIVNVSVPCVEADLVLAEQGFQSIRQLADLIQVEETDTIPG